MKTKTQLFNVIYAMLDENTTYALKDVYINDNKTYTQLTFLMRSNNHDYQIDIRNNDGRVLITWVTYVFDDNIELVDKYDTHGNELESEFQKYYPNGYKLIKKHSDSIEFGRVF